jgi:hypothetical protein
MCPNLQSHSDLEEDRTRNQPSAGEIDAFQRLVRDLSDILGPSSGIDSADVDPGSLQRRMEAYQSNKAEWSRYALGDPSRPYTRNLVDEGNGKSNLVSTNEDIQGEYLNVATVDTSMESWQGESNT